MDARSPRGDRHYNGRDKVLRSINTVMYFEFDRSASRRDAGKIARHFSAGIMQRRKDESRRDD